MRDEDGKKEKENINGHDARKNPNGNWKWGNMTQEGFLQHLQDVKGWRKMAYTIYSHNQYRSYKS